MAKNAMPKSKAKTAYGLLSEIRKLILEEPRRYDQEAWRYYPPPDDPMAPACGTTACVAGWVATLKPCDGQYAIQERADEVLGLTAAGIHTYYLFNSDAAGDTGYTRKDRRRHARAGAAHIAAFQQKYAKQLKAKRV